MNSTRILRCCAGLHILALSIFAPFAVGADAESQALPPLNMILLLADDQGWTGTSVRMNDGRDDSKSDY